MPDRTQLYHSGCLSDGWRLFGAHPATEGTARGWWFNVWAPRARQVSLVGDFNDWQAGACPLTRKGEFWQGFAADLPAGSRYKYAVTGADGILRFKADPYGFAAEVRPGTASRVCDIEHFHWTDDAFRRSRQPGEMRVDLQRQTFAVDLGTAHLGRLQSAAHGAHPRTLGK